MSRKVRISTISFLLTNGTVTKADRFDQALRYLKDAVADKPDLILLLELYETMGTCETAEMRRIEDPDAHRAALIESAEAEDGPFSTKLSDFASENTTIVVSNNLIREGDKAYNQATFYGRLGDIVGRYRKVQLTVGEYEEKGTTPGDDLDVVEIEGVRYGTFICNDQAFPEICQVYALQGADVLLHPTQAAGPTETIRSEMLRTRAHDASCFLVTSTFLQDRHLSWQHRESRATICDYNGYTLAETGYREGHATATLDLDERRWTSWCKDGDHGESIRFQHRADLYARYYQELSKGKENMVAAKRRETSDVRGQTTEPAS